MQYVRCKHWMMFCIYKIKSNSIETLYQCLYFDNINKFPSSKKKNFHNFIISNFSYIYIKFVYADKTYKTYNEWDVNIGQCFYILKIIMNFKKIILLTFLYKYINICFRVHKKIKSTTYAIQIFNIFFYI